MRDENAIIISGSPYDVYKNVAQLRADGYTGYILVEPETDAGLKIFKGSFSWEDGKPMTHTKSKHHP